ncbi:hypothetical protein [cf. Phormidesmis sp. LEGE 11477]|uniref:hypothetical protein n=1 Tax=cf. Phormidesmis sp. LEGE 11477 TaxID=1828680 RepID=UPI00187F7C47|nr:hypothetical protein [cf. Phormidesmis sp. LEGE 11477]MBE9064728.1 hypothetical protein [cf. Phormidesmis sp. LEGE 11477]
MLFLLRNLLCHRRFNALPTKPSTRLPAQNLTKKLSTKRLSIGLLATTVSLIAACSGASDVADETLVPEGKASEATSEKNTKVENESGDESKVYVKQIDDYAGETSALGTEVPEAKEVGSDSQMWLEADATYEEQDFSRDLYAEILEEDAYCLSTGSCGDVRYLFQDVLMIAAMGEFGSTKTTLTPHESISKSQALAYARMLDTDSVIDFEDSLLIDNNEGESDGPVIITENYFEAGLPSEGAAYELASIRSAQIVSDTSGEILRVLYRVDVL